MRLLTITLLSLVIWANAQREYPEWINGTFPEDFQWGFATASYQIEGSWDADGKGENIWDRFTHEDPSRIFDGTNGDDACDSYKRYQVDVQLIKNLGGDFYRFSVSWSRILPRSATEINEAGVDYYNNLINELLANHIEPLITLYHWDLPQRLQDLGGWQNHTIADEFEAYANVLFSRFGDRVKKWITINEPFVMCVLGHGDGAHAPGLTEADTGPYICGHNVLRSHARAYRLYERSYKSTQNGLVGITLDASWCQPLDPTNATHVSAAERCQQSKHGWFGFPIYHGDYPPLMKVNIQRKSEESGLEVSRLPEFTEEEKLAIKGSSDFLGFNHYTTELVVPENHTARNWYADRDVSTFQDESWDSSASDWLKHVPWGFRKLLNWIKDTYDNPLVYVTESGFSDKDEVGLNDEGRIKYYREYINEMLKAVTIDNCNVKAYTAWSLMDNFEWRRGYSERFGVHWVNFTHPDRPRIAKKSAAVLKQIFEDNGFPSSGSAIAASVFTISAFAIFSVI